TLISMPRIFAYHSAERVTSLTLMTMWSSALTLTGMTYPFVALSCARAALALARFACYNAVSHAFNNNEKRSSCNDFSPPRARSDRHRYFHFRDWPERIRRGLSNAPGALPGRLSAGRRHRHPGAPDRPAPVGEARPAIRDREQAGRRQQYRYR